MGCCWAVLGDGVVSALRWVVTALRWVVTALRWVVVMALFALLEQQQMCGRDVLLCPARHSFVTLVAQFFALACLCVLSARNPRLTDMHIVRSESASTHQVQHSIAGPCSGGPALAYGRARPRRPHGRQGIEMQFITDRCDDCNSRRTGVYTSY
ncbi:uncharacterized protein M421DRAFT_227519 [Didymella exigua CBS 183.55]|uniref:Uncharacterized protein n=1 Tax=Didymella exigua CBS 183.55 TaxID=1150837 RepID=A0A6A5RCE8_9PLEO|nr:uncharacterized protein M421DRAFT_227519 [Didymella exigua CBS 183.55]KAF1925921.1 hypothetical protein M421DRAFT_227519 [Didymella exigua CBS 183.55]